jgi:hypothetical protein
MTAAVSWGQHSGCTNAALESDVGTSTPMLVAPYEYNTQNGVKGHFERAASHLSLETWAQGLCTDD